MMSGSSSSLCIKAKWITLKSWLVPTSLILLHRRKRQRQKEQKQIYLRQKQQQQQQQQQRRPSHCTSCSSRPSSDFQDDQQAPSFFKRRSSQSSQMTLADLQREAEKIYDLFLLALDELNYAGDSQGTFYYINDRVSAEEAIENFSSASMQLMNMTYDPQYKSQIQAMVRPRLLHLQAKFDELPVADDPLTYRHSIYCS